MPAKKPASPRSLKSNVRKVDRHVVAEGEYRELPQLTDEALARAVIRRRGRPLTQGVRKMISLRLPQSVLEQWQATGPGWQTRMVKCLARAVGVKSAG